MPAVLSAVNFGVVSLDSACTYVNARLLCKRFVQACCNRVHSFSCLFFVQGRALRGYQTVQQKALDEPRAVTALPNLKRLAVSWGLCLMMRAWLRPLWAGELWLLEGVGAGKLATGQADNARHVAAGRS